MKTTVKLHGGAQVIIKPAPGGIHLNCMATVRTGLGDEVHSVSVTLTPDQFGALMFGGEMALESVAVRHLQGAM